VSVIERNGEGVGASYRHVSKTAQFGQSAALGNTLLKWYEIAPDGEPVPPSVSDLARLGLADAARLGELRLGGELGFVILHSCGAGFYFLLVSTWQKDNELWETVWAKNGSDEAGFRPWPLDGTHRPTFCVWELGVVAHERLAWARFLSSARDRDSRLEYMRDTYEGVV
jgi:hypothetical protein